MKRQNQAFFDQEAWEREREEAFEREKEAERAGGKRKRTTKEDVKRFKEKKEAKKMCVSFSLLRSCRWEMGMVVEQENRS
jgi:hypothetical protein